MLGELDKGVRDALFLGCSYPGILATLLMEGRSNVTPISAVSRPRSMVR